MQFLIKSEFEKVPSKLSTNTTPKLNVGMLVHGYYPRDIRVRREAEALVEQGYRVEVVCLRVPEEQGKQREPTRDIVNGVHIIRLPVSRKRGKIFRYLFEYIILIILGAWKLSLLHFKNPFQIVHIHNMPDILILAGLIPKWMGAKLILDIHDPMTELYASTSRLGKNRWVLSILNWQQRFSCRLADRVISVNESMRENLERKGIQQEKIFILHNFPDTKYLPIKNDISSWPRHSDGLSLLYAGTITEHYRLDIAIKALSLASKHLPWIKLRILGDGNDLIRVLRLANDLGVMDYIEHANPVGIDKLKDIMKDNDIGISCHQGGLFGDLQFTGKILDYLTQGLAVISSRTRTLVRYIPEEAVFYFDPESAEDMAKKIIKMWNSPDLVRKKMKYAKKLLPHYTWQKERYKLISFYQGLIKNQKIEVCI